MKILKKQPYPCVVTGGVHLIHLTEMIQVGCTVWSCWTPVLIC